MSRTPIPPISRIFRISAFAAVVSTFSCSSDGGGGGSNPPPTEPHEFCVSMAQQMCLVGPFTSCSDGWSLSNDCPYPNVIGGSSSSLAVSSSSLGVSSSSLVVSSSSLAVSSSSSEIVETKCGNGNKYHNPVTQFCDGDDVVDKCGGATYNPETRFCHNNEVIIKCNFEAVYDPATQRCQSNVVETKCGTGWYNAETQDCCNNSTVFQLATQRCRFEAIENKCGEGWYDETIQGCCNNEIFPLSSQRCNLNVLETKCGTAWYNPSEETQGCCNNTLFALSNQRCQNNVLETKCGTGYYNEATQGCCNDAIYTLSSHYCFGDNSVFERCGTRKEAFDPDLYECRVTGKIYLKEKPQDDAGQEYEAVLIGNQTWMAENLNYNANSSKCFSNSDANCAIYGRLYTWATALDLTSSCNSTTCASQVNAKHKGICPTGWHVPSQAEWEELKNFVQSDKNCTNCDARYLKATSSWSSCGLPGTGSSYTCEDAYGFAGSPGGYNEGGIGGSNNFRNDGGHWWSATEYDADYAYNRDMNYNYELVNRHNYYETYLFSVRCVQD